MLTEDTTLGSVGIRSNWDPEQAVDGDGPWPHVHFVTYLAIFAVNLAFVAQNFAITGAGTVWLKLLSTKWLQCLVG